MGYQYQGYWLSIGIKCRILGTGLGVSLFLPQSPEFVVDPSSGLALGT